MSSGLNRSRLARTICSFLLAASLGTGHASSGEERFKPFKLKTPEGQQVSLSSVLGKATLIVFFYPTCAYCKVALPEIQKLYDAYKDQGLSMVCINVVPEENSLIGEWRSRHGYTIPVLLGGRSVQGDYKLTMTPTHVLIDEQGRVLSRRNGFKPGDERVVEREIRHSLGLTD